MSNANMKEELRALIAEIAEKDEIPDDVSFKDLGIDSMMGVEIVAAIERKYQVKIEDAELVAGHHAECVDGARGEEARRRAPRSRRLRDRTGRSFERSRSLNACRCRARPRSSSRPLVARPDS